MKRTLTIAMMMLVCSAAQAQQVNPEPRDPALYFAAQGVGSFAKGLSYASPGKGWNVEAGIPLPQHFYLIQNLQFVSERKVWLREGRTISSATALEYNFGGGVFAVAQISVGNHNNELWSKWATRAKLGGGFQWLGKQSQLPVLKVHFAGIIPLSDPNKLGGVEAGVKSFYQFSGHAIGVTGGFTQSVVNFADPTGNRSWAGYRKIEGGLFVNLSSIMGY